MGDFLYWRYLPYGFLGFWRKVGREGFLGSCSSYLNSKVLNFLFSRIIVHDFYNKMVEAHVLAHRSTTQDTNNPQLSHVPPS